MEKRKVQVIHLQIVRDRECLVVCAVDTKMKPTHIQMMTMGTIDYCPAPMPEIYKAALLSNAPNIVLFYNYPSGNCTYSQEDILLTERALEAGRLLDIRLIDHIILGEGDDFCSLRGSGKIPG